MANPAKKPNYTEFSDPRLASLYDQLNPFGNDSEFFCKQAHDLGARNIIDLGCGTGLLTLELAKRGHSATGIEPAAAMLSVAQEKPGANAIKWIRGSYEQMQELRADMIIMTSHVAQFFLDDADWLAMLRTAHKTLNNGGYLVFDIRRLTHPPFPTFPTEDSPKEVKNTSAGTVQWWSKLLRVENKRVSYELHYLFADSGQKIASLNELAFRSQDEITQALVDTGFEVQNIYGDWDKSLVTDNSPEMIFIAKEV